MKQNCLIILILAIVVLSCNNKNNNQDDTTTSEERYKNIKDDVIVFDTLAPVKVLYKDSILNWKGYFKVTKDLERLKKTSPTEVLTSAEELVADIELMKDSINVKALKVKGIKSRINVMLNQALRLQDMNNIPAITVPEIAKQTQGLFVIYRMINTKINAIYQQIDFENELIEDNFIFSKLDSIE